MTEITNLYLLLPLAFLIGISVGSFVTMASYRLPRGEDIVFKPSHCPLCSATLKTSDLFPLLSWIMQKGRCRHCRASISARYPLIECFLGLLFVALVFFYGPTVTTLFYTLLATELAILIVTDLEHYIIPDSLQITLFITGIVYAVYRDTPLATILSGIGLGLGIGLLLHYGYFYLRKKDGLGFGDVKFLAVAGVWMPVETFVPFLFFAGLIGTLTGIFWRVAGRGALFPFGPALACSLFMNVLIPDILSKITL